MNLIKILVHIRAKLNLALFPMQGYWMAVRTIKPISTKFGFDRGKPIDRFWIESFLEKNKGYIRGNCLEVTDNTYTLRFGATNVSQSDVLDIDKNNVKANIIGDLRNLLNTVDDNTYDCIVLTHVLGLVDRIEDAISECYRILKPGGVILATSSCFSPTYGEAINYWRFTPDGARYIFEKTFKKEYVEVFSYGNVLSGQCFWAGLAQEDLSKEELEYNDLRYPCVVGVIAIKGKEKN